MSFQRRLLFATSGAIFFALCGLLVFLIGLNFRLELIRTIGVLMILGGLMATIVLFLYVLKSHQYAAMLLPKRRKLKQTEPKE